MNPDPQALLKIARTKMPFGRHAGMLLVDLPETYVVWFSKQGFPEGELGDLLRAVYEIRVNGLEYLFRDLKPQESLDGFMQSPKVDERNQ